jgi:hypothetical protein
METPDQTEQQAHIEHNRQILDRRAYAAAIGEHQPDHGKREIDTKRPRHRREIHVRREGLGRGRIEQSEDHHDRELEPADQPLRRILLGADRRLNTGRQARGDRI